jgi:hypothetical protein
MQFMLPFWPGNLSSGCQLPFWSNHRARGGFSHAGGPIARAQVFALLATIFLWMF